MKEPTLTLDQIVRIGCLRAEIRIHDRVQELVDVALDEIARKARRARTLLHLPPYYLSEGRRLVLPKSFKCPECSGDSRVVIEIDAWDSNGMPLSGGILVRCQAEDEEFWNAMEEDRDPDWEHRGWQSDWQGIVTAAERFCARYVRVARDG